MIEIFDKKFEKSDVYFITPIFQPNTRSFDDSDSSSDDERDWMTNFKVIFHDGGSYTFTDVRYGLENLLNAHKQLIAIFHEQIN